MTLIFSTQNLQLYEMHIYGKHQVAIFSIAKVMANVKSFRTDGGGSRKLPRQTSLTTKACGLIKEIIATVHQVSIDKSPQLSKETYYSQISTGMI